MRPRAAAIGAIWIMLMETTASGVKPAGSSHASAEASSVTGGRRLAGPAAFAQAAVEAIASGSRSAGCQTR